MVSAGEVELVQETYYSGETVQAYLSNYSSNPLANIYVLYDDEQINIAPLVVEYQDKYFAYFDLPLSLEEGNYELVVVNDRANFSIQNSTKVLSIKPGIFILDDESIKIELSNVGEEDITVELGSDNQEVVLRKTILDINVGESKNAWADFDEVSKDTIITVRYNSKSYSIPLIVPIVEVVDEIVEVNESFNETIVVEEGSLEFVSQYTEQRLDVERDKIYEASLLVQNNYDNDLDIKVVFGGDLSEILEIENIPTKIKKSSNITLDIVMNKNKGALPKEYQGDLQIISDEETISMPFYVEVVDVVVEEEEIEDIPGEDVFPEIQKEGMDPVILIGVVMIGILLIILVVLYWKMKEKPKKKYKDVLRQRLR